MGTDFKPTHRYTDGTTGITREVMPGEGYGRGIQYWRDKKGLNWPFIERDGDRLEPIEPEQPQTVTGPEAWELLKRGAVLRFVKGRDLFFLQYRVSNGALEKFSCGSWSKSLCGRRQVEAATWTIVSPPQDEPTIGTAEWALRELEQGREVASKRLLERFPDNWWQPSSIETFRRELPLYKSIDWVNREMWEAMQSPQPGDRQCSECNLSLKEAGIPPVLERRGFCSLKCKHKADDRMKPRCLVCLKRCEGRLCNTHWNAWNQVATSLHKRDDFERWCREQRLLRDVPRCRATKEGEHG